MSTSTVDPALVDRIRDRLVRVLESVVDIIGPGWQKRGAYHDAIAQLRAKQPVLLNDLYYGEHLANAIGREGVTASDPRYVLILYSLG